MEDEWKSGCDRPKLWQVCGELVCSEHTTLNGNRVLGKLPDLTSWEFNILMVHGSDMVSHKLSEVRMPDWAGGPVLLMLSRLLGVRALSLSSRSPVDARSAGLCPKIISCGSQ